MYLTSRGHRKRVLSATGIIFALLVGACSSNSGQGNSSSSASGGIVTLSVAGPITSLDPAKAVSFQDLQAASALYDPLVLFDPQGKLIPGLADSWTDTPTSATFHLRSGVTCSDGTALTASMAAASLQRYLTPSTNAPLLARVAGAKNTGQVTGDDKASTLTVTLSKPWSELVAGLTSPSTGIVCPAGLKDPSTLLAGSSGTGPFVAASQISGATYTFKSRAGYSWGGAFADQPKGAVPATLVLKVVADDNTAANLQSTGSLSIASYTSQAWTRFNGQSGYTPATQDQSDTMLLFNESPGHPTADKAVRYAIAQALDRNNLTAVLGNGNGKIEPNLGDSNYPCFDASLKDALPPFDPSAAKAVLQGKQVKVIGTTLVAGGNGTSAVLAQLNQAGAAATLQNTNNEAWVSALFSGKNEWDVTILVYANTFNSLTSAAGFFVGDAPPKGQNIGAVSNATAAASYAQAGAGVGADKCSATTALQRSLFTSADVLPLAAVPVTNVFSGGAQGVVVKGFAVPSSIRMSGK